MREPFEFQPNDESLSVESAVFQALGAASTCWENLSGTGVFDSTRAKEIGDKLLAFLAVQAEETEELKEALKRIKNYAMDGDLENRPDLRIIIQGCNQGLNQAKREPKSGFARR